MTTFQSHAQKTRIPVGEWRIDPGHSTVGFAVKHMMIATVRGRFREFEGLIEVHAAGPARASGRVTVGSIDTGSRDRDAHLLSADFFDAGEHREITFEATSLERRDDERLTIRGQLTIRGITREVMLEGVLTGAGRDPWGNERLALEAHGQIDREDFGLRWNKALESGGVLVGRVVELQLDLSTVRESSAAKAA